MKFSKRLYALAAMNKDEKVLKALKPLVISSNLPAINQISADIETIISMIQKVHKSTCKTDYYQSSTTSNLDYP